MTNIELKDIHAKWRYEDTLIKNFIIDYIKYRINTLPDHVIISNLRMRHLFITEDDLKMYKDLIRNND